MAARKALQNGMGMVCRGTPAGIPRAFLRTAEGSWRPETR